MFLISKQFLLHKSNPPLWQSGWKREKEVGIETTYDKWIIPRIKVIWIYHEDQISNEGVLMSFGMMNWFFIKLNLRYCIKIIIAFFSSYSYHPDNWSWISLHMIKYERAYMSSQDFTDTELLTIRKVLNQKYHVVMLKFPIRK